MCVRTVSTEMRKAEPISDWSGRGSPVVEPRADALTAFDQSRGNFNGDPTHSLDLLWKSREH